MVTKDLMSNNPREIEANKVKPGQWLRMLREYWDLSREALATATARSEEAILSWEEGNRTPRAESIKPVLKYLRVPDELVENHVRWFRNLPPLERDWQPWRPWDLSKAPPQLIIEPPMEGHQAATRIDSITLQSIPFVSPTHIPGDQPKQKSKSVLFRYPAILTSLGILIAFSLLMLLPKLRHFDITVPKVDSSIAVDIDGKCDEYSRSFSKPFLDKDGQQAFTYFQHDNDYLYVCISAYQGHGFERNGAVFFSERGVGNDTNLRQEAYELVVYADPSAPQGPLESFKYGDHGAQNPWLPAPWLSKAWRGSSITSTQNNESYEFAISIHQFDLGTCKRSFRVATYHQWVENRQIDYGWPDVSDSWREPARWIRARLADAPCNTEPWWIIWWNSLIS